MIDLSSVFREARKRQDSWGYDFAAKLTEQIASLRLGFEALNDYNLNWCYVLLDKAPVVYVYTLFPVVIIRDDILDKILSTNNLSVINALKAAELAGFYKDFDRLYCFSAADAQELLPYPVQEMNLDLKGFSVEEFTFETG